MKLPLKSFEHEFSWKYQKPEKGLKPPGKDWKIFVLNIGYQTADKNYAQNERRRSKCNEINNRLLGAAIAQWICLYLPSCHPGFKSQAHHQRFYPNCQFVLYLSCEKNENKQKEAGFDPFKIRLLRSITVHSFLFINGMMWPAAALPMG